MDGLKRQNGILLGVCGGIAARYNISPLVVRLVFLFSGLGWGGYCPLHHPRHTHAESVGQVTMSKEQKGVFAIANTPFYLHQRCLLHE
ncbi:MAG: PspC domain-containing protein [Chloroflexi bacterium]|nr:PspC domain-containing protein [Chloroflexota bacterium]